MGSSPKRSLKEEYLKGYAEDEKTRPALLKFAETLPKLFAQFETVLSFFSFLAKKVPWT